MALVALVALITLAAGVAGGAGVRTGRVRSCAETAVGGGLVRPPGGACAQTAAPPTLPAHILSAVPPVAHERVPKPLGGQRFRHTFRPLSHTFRPLTPHVPAARIILRFPAFVVRDQPGVVAAQIREALGGRRVAVP